MKKYDFNYNELWFSRRALQELACADRLGFGRYLKRLWRSFIRKDGTTPWVQDEVYLPRIEGGREVCRKSEIFDLETSYQIMAKYERHVPPDFGMVLKRFEELKKEERRKRLPDK